MEKKTIGGFIAALRKANGMTQKDLAERLNVSDKTVSRWERDEGLPDLSLIPVIAEIFGVSCDELLRGERRSPDERAEHMDSPESVSTQKGAKERRRILDASMAWYKNLSFITMGIAVLGLIAAMISNLCLQLPIVAFLVAATFYLVAVVCEAVFANNALYKVSGDAQEEDDGMQFRHSVILLAEKCFGFVIMLFAASVPLLKSEVGLLWEIYEDSGWLFSGAVSAVLALLIYAIIIHFVNASFLRKGTYRMSEKEEEKYWVNHRLKLRIGVVLVCVFVVTALVHTAIWNMDKSVLVAGTTFTDYDSFVQFMEQGTMVEESDGKVYSYTEEESDQETEYRTVSVETIEDEEGNVLCQYLWVNASVAQINHGDSSDRLPITVYTNSDLTEANVIWRILVYGMFVVYVMEILAGMAVYQKKRVK